MHFIIRPKGEDVEQEVGLIVPSLNGEPLWAFPPDVVEGIRQMVARLFSKNGIPDRVAMVAALRKEGVTYLSRALAAVIANDLGHRVCLVDLNLWWPNPIEGDPEEPHSLAEVIAGRQRLNEVLIPTGWPNLTLLPAGEVPKEIRPTVAHSQALKDILQKLSEGYDHLVLDVPAILAATDAIPLASLASAACLVIRQGVTHGEDVARALDEIEHMQMVGVLMNQAKYATPKRLIKWLA